MILVIRHLVLILRSTAHRCSSNMKALLLLTIVLNVVDTVYSVTAIGASQCPQNIRALRHLHVYSDACLVLVRNKLTWKDARTSCRKTGGDLVMIKDADKQAFILNALKADHWDQDLVWIGTSDLQHEGDWRWVDGSKVTFSRFASGQGNNHNDGFFFANGGTEDCAVLDRGDRGKWHDYHCESIVANIGYHFSYICEFRKLKTLPTTQTPAPTTTAHRETPAPTTTAHRETPAPTTTAHRKTPAPTTAAHRETPAPTTTAHRETPAPTTTAHRETPAPTTAAHRETPPPTTMNRETPAPTTVANRETPAPTTAANRETPAPTTAANRETPAPTTVVNRETPAPTSAGNRETPAPTTVVNRETPAPTTMSQRQTLRPTAVFGRRR